MSDVDLLYELPNELYARFNGHAGNGQSALLAHVRASIQKTYSVTERGAQECGGAFLHRRGAEQDVAEAIA